MLWLIWAVGLIAALVVYLHNVYSFFSRRGVKTDTVVPFFGSMARIVFSLEHLLDSTCKTYFKFPEERFVGRFEFTKPVLMIRDLELVKKITIKDFEHFYDHRFNVNDEGDPIFSRTLFAMRGSEWRDMRPTMSPAFTSAKMRQMVPFMLEIGDQMVANIKKKMSENGASYLDTDFKDLMTRCACDTIASCAFGLKVDSLSNMENDFFVVGRKASSFTIKQTLVFLLASSVPWLVKLLNLKMIEKNTQDYFRRLVLSTMHNREQHNILRPDMIHILMEAKKGKLSYVEKNQNNDAGFATVQESDIGKRVVTRVWEDDDLIAQAVVFLLGGFETIASTMAFFFYELAVNPDVQDRLLLEIRETEASNGGKFDFNTVQQMTYLDMVVSELLRKYSAAIILDRLCTKDYNLGKPNDKANEDYIIRKGEGLQIPVWAIHHDPEYYPDPEKFDPERFSEENKQNLNPYAYMPFGLGPRNCIGSRFALCELKVMAYQLLRHMEVCPSSRTVIPAKVAPGTFNIVMQGGHWLRIKPRI